MCFTEPVVDFLRAFLKYQIRNPKIPSDIEPIFQYLKNHQAKLPSTRIDKAKPFYYIYQQSQNNIPLKDKNIVWLYLFLAATLADLAFVLEGNSQMRFFSKPLILLGLILYFYRITKPIAWTLLTKSILAALIFSWIGDILLMWNRLFIYGLGAFLMAHICYIIGFRVAQKNSTPLEGVNFVKAFFYNLPIYLASAFVFYLINPGLGSMKIPVVTYIVVILGMVTTARDRYKKCNPASFWQVFIGAILFFISDGAIAINRFFVEFPESGILIMGTYAVAQLLIVMGIRSFLIQPSTG